MKPYLLTLLILLISGSSCSLLKEADNEDFNDELISSDFYLPGFPVSAGSYHACVVLSTDNTIRCWGEGDLGRLGDNKNLDSNTPVTVLGISSATDVSAGGSHTCALLSSGSVRCWGSNSYGQLGDGSGVDKSTPVTVSGITSARGVSAGDSHTCAVLSDGSVRCWGGGQYGRLGDGSSSDRSTPVTVSGITSAISVSSGYQHTCAVLSDGSVRCWGRGDNNRLGDGSQANTNTTPVTVSGISSAKDVSAGSSHTCALLSSGSVRCWGSNSSGQFGDGSLATVTRISANTDSTCALLSDKTVRCWGSNSYGQLGDGTSGLASFSSNPVTVAGVSYAGTIAVGSEFSCASRSDFLQVKCWGRNNSGQLGDGTNTDRVTPVMVVF